MHCLCHVFRFILTFHSFMSAFCSCLLRLFFASFAMNAKFLLHLALAQRHFIWSLRCDWNSKTHDHIRSLSESRLNLKSMSLAMFPCRRSKWADLKRLKTETLGYNWIVKIECKFRGESIKHPMMRMPKKKNTENFDFSLQFFSNKDFGRKFQCFENCSQLTIKLKQAKDQFRVWATNWIAY